MNKIQVGEISGRDVRPAFAVVTPAPGPATRVRGAVGFEAGDIAQVCVATESFVKARPAAWGLTTPNRAR